MINKIILISLIDPEDPDKALEYLSDNMTENEFIDWISRKITEQKNNKSIKIPIPIMFNIFMEYIQDICNNPYSSYKSNYSYKKYADLNKSTNKLTDEKFGLKYFINLTNTILKEHDGNAKKLRLSVNFYGPKNSKNEIDIFVPNESIDLTNFIFAKEDSE